jgi:hypothetical protein
MCSTFTFQAALSGTLVLMTHDNSLRKLYVKLHTLKPFVLNLLRSYKEARELAEEEMLFQLTSILVGELSEDSELKQKYFFSCCFYELLTLLDYRVGISEKLWVNMRNALGRWLSSF